MRGKLLFVVRRLHLYLSVFFAPLLLLFIITGWAQTVGFAHEATPTLLERLAVIHKSDQFSTLDPVPWKVRSRDGSVLYIGGQTGTPRIAGHTGTSMGQRFHTWPMRYLVVAMCIALLISISLGLVLAFTVVRNRVPVWITLILGVATPVFFLALAHFR